MENQIILNQEIQKELDINIQKSNEITVITSDDYISASEFLKTLKLLQTKITAFIRPLVESAYKNWKLIKKKENTLLNPVINAENTIKLAMRKFQQEQERKRREEEIRLAELARKEAERLQKRAEKASKKGQAEKAEALQQQALETEMMKPIVQSEVPKVAGIGSRESWKFRIVDIDLIPREFMTPNLQRIGEVARTTKGTLKIPGIKFYKEDIITSRT